MKDKGRIACFGAVSMVDGGPLTGPIGVPGLIGLLAGENRGKRRVRVAPDPA